MGIMVENVMCFNVIFVISIFVRMTVNTPKTYPTLISNPVAIFDQHSKGVVVFVQASDGQVIVLIVNDVHVTMMLT